MDYNTSNVEKIVILMTDGTNYTPPGVYSAYGFLSQGALGGTTTDPEVAATDVDNRTLAACQALKDKGVIIYTIGFGTETFTDPPALSDRQDPTKVAHWLLLNCATDVNHYFPAPTNAQLNIAFQTIAHELNNIRVSQ